MLSSWLDAIAVRGVIKTVYIDNNGRRLLDELMLEKRNVYCSQNVSNSKGNMLKCIDIAWCWHGMKCGLWEVEMCVVTTVQSYTLTDVLYAADMLCCPQTGWSRPLIDSRVCLALDLVLPTLAAPVIKSSSRDREVHEGMSSLPYLPL